MEYSYETKAPKIRIAVLIGKSGETKKKIEETTHTKLIIDSKEGDVTIEGSDPLGLLSAREIVKAVGRGFNPEVALLLLKPDYILNMINLNDFTKNANTLNRIKGRVIGKDGKTRNIIEDHTETYISVYGKTIAIIGEPENVTTARKAVEALLTGSPHASVYKWLEKKRAQLHESKITNNEEFRENLKIKEDTKEE
ncbi:MAG: KH domain-containing protein [Candidatus Woesearchaeota archaeon]